MSGFGEYIQKLNAKTLSTKDCKKAKKIKGFLLGFGGAGVAAGAILFFTGFIMMLVKVIQAMNNMSAAGGFSPTGIILAVVGIFVLAPSAILLRFGLMIVIGNAGINFADVSQRCPKCGDPVEENEDFCSKCGEKIIKTKICMECGFENGYDDKFCKKCGAKLND